MRDTHKGLDVLINNAGHCRLKFITSGFLLWDASDHHNPKIVGGPVNGPYQDGSSTVLKKWLFYEKPLDLPAGVDPPDTFRARGLPPQTYFGILKNETSTER